MKMKKYLIGLALTLGIGGVAGSAVSDITSLNGTNFTLDQNLINNIASQVTTNLSTDITTMNTKLDTVILGNKVMPVIGEWTSFTPTFNNATMSNNGSFYRRVGSDIQVKVDVSALADATGFVQWNMNGGLTGVTPAVSKFGGRQIFGAGITLLGTNNYKASPSFNGVNYQARFSLDGGGSLDNINPIGGAADGGFDTNDRLTFEASYPVAEWQGAANVAITGTGLATSTSSGLVTYENYVTKVTPLLNATTSPSITVKQSRVGKMVTITLSPSGKVTKNGANGSLSVAIDSDFIPPASLSFETYGVVNNIAGVVYYSVTASGTIDMLGTTAGANINAGQLNVGWDGPITFTYSVY